MKLHLGCGEAPRDGWVNLDTAGRPGVDAVVDYDACADVRLPFADDSVDEFQMGALLQHLQHSLPLMAELYRIAGPDAKLEIRMPHGATDQPGIARPVVRPYFHESFYFFAQPLYWRADYGYRGDWQPEETELLVDARYCQGKTPAQVMAAIQRSRNLVAAMRVVLRAVKPLRAQRQELLVRTPVTITPLGQG